MSTVEDLFAALNLPGTALWYMRERTQLYTQLSSRLGARGLSFTLRRREGRYVIRVYRGLRRGPCLLHAEHWQELEVLQYVLDRFPPILDGAA